LDKKREEFSIIGRFVIQCSRTTLVASRKAMNAFARVLFAVVIAAFPVPTPAPGMINPRPAEEQRVNKFVPSPEMNDGPLRVDCKGKINGGAPSEDLDNGLPLDGCVARGSCIQEKWLRDGAAPMPDDPGGPLPKIVALTFPQWGSFYHFSVETMYRMYV
jgi:hypothetical protein